MKKVIIKEIFNTSMGKIITTECGNFSVGDRIIGDDGNEYTVKNIQLSTKPTDLDVVSLIVE